MPLIQRPTGTILNVTAIQTLVGALLLFPEDRTGRELHLDLSAVTFVLPSGIVPLVTHLHALPVACQRDIRLIYPKSENVLNYLMASGMMRCLSDFTEMDIPAVFLKRNPSTKDSVLPFRSIQTHSDAGRVREEVDRVLGEDAGAWRSILCSAIAEMCSNICCHSSDSLRMPIGFFAAQRYRNGDGDTYIDFTVCDAGIGIKQSLSSHYPHLARLRDEVVLGQMIRDGLSSRKQNGGNGYYAVEKAVKEHRGSFTLRSGAGQVERLRHQKPLQQHKVEPWPGTLLTVKIMCE